MIETSAWVSGLTTLLYVSGRATGLLQYPLANGFSGAKPWDLNKHPDPNSTDHLIFSSASSLLQTWGNTRYRNGHSIVPGIIPPGTLLYHGTHTPQPPPAGYPEWLAVNPEHSYIFCTSLRSPPNASHPAPNAEPCWHLTFVTTRPIEVLYFDGASAGKMPGGCMDSQDVVLWGEVIDTPERRLDERRRAAELCQLLGKARGRGEGGVDGFVRMELDFEVLLCDFTDGLELVSALNLEYSDFPDWSVMANVPLPASGHRLQKSDLRIANGSLPSLYWLPGVRGLLAGLRHAQFPGETRIQLLYHSLITFYDMALFPSLNIIRRGQNRWEHRLDGIGKEDAKGLRDRLGEILGSKANRGPGMWEGSGVDWKSTLRVVQMRWEDGLEISRHLLGETVNRYSGVDDLQQLEHIAKRVHSYIEGMLKPYILNSTHPGLSFTATSTQDSRHDERSPYTWAQPVYRLCATTHTQYLTKLRLTPSESLLLSSIRGVENEICRVLVGIWASGVEHTLSVSSVQAHRTFDEKKRPLQVGRWLQGSKRQLEELAAWLDWDVWVKCEPACPFDEICYLPTWVFFPPSDGEEDGRLNKRPEPKCWKRIHPL